MKLRIYTLLLVLFALSFSGRSFAQVCLQPGDVVIYDEGESGDLGGNVNVPPAEIFFPEPVVSGTSYVVIASAPDDERDAFRFTVPDGTTLTSFNIDEFTDCASISPRIKVWDGPDKNGTEIAVIPDYTGGNIIELNPGEYAFLLDHDPTPDCSIGCYRIEFVFTAVEGDTPEAPVIDEQNADACLGASGFGARISVDDPGEGLEVYWRVLSAPAGASFGPGDELPPHVNVAEYRTDQRPRGEWFRLKQAANAVAPGVYMFEAFVKNAAGLSSEAVGPFTINADLLPDVSFQYNIPSGGCQAGKAVCSGQTTDIGFNVTDADELIVVNIRHDFEFSDGGLCAQGAIDGYGPLTGGTIQIGDNVIGGIFQTFVNNTGESIRVNYQVQAKSTTGSMCEADPKWFGFVVDPAPSYTCKDIEVSLTSNFVFLNAGMLVDIENYGNASTCTYNALGVSPNLITCDDLGSVVPVTVTVNGPNGIETCMGTVTVNPSEGLSAPWQQSDLGTSSLGTAVSDPCGATGFEYTLSGSGIVYPTTSDNYNYVSQSLCGDVTIAARLTEFPVNGFAGLMIRNGVGASDAGMAVLVQGSTPTTPSQLLQTRTRTMNGGALNIDQFYKPNPTWLRLRRQGSWVFAEYSSNGFSWNYIHAEFVGLNPCVEVGMIVQSNTGAEVTAQFSNVVVTGMPGGYSEPTPVVSESVALATNLQLYPNPASDRITLQFGSEISQPTTLILRNQLGQVVEQHLLEIPAFSTEMEVSNLLSGLYLLEVRTDGNTPQIIKFVKE